MKRNFLIFAIVLLLLAFSTTAMARTFVLYEFKAEGVDQTTAGLVTSLMRSELAGYSLATIELIADPPCHDQACALRTLQEKNADAVIVGRVVQLGSSATLYIDAVWKKGVDHYKVFLDDVGEITRLAPRLAEAITKRKPYGDTAKVTSVSKAEQDAYQRVKGDFSWGPALGAMVPIGGAYGGANVMYTIDLMFRYETQHLGFEFDTGVYFNSPGMDDAAAYEWPLDFAMMYFFSDGDQSPFVGGSIGLHAIGITTNLDKNDEKSYGGWMLSGSAFGGYELLRTHRLHVAFRAGYRGGFITLDGRGAHGPFFNIAMTF